MVDQGTSPPTGTVSFLFTDVEGSTRLWDRAPEAMRQALVRHDDILRSAIVAGGGFVFSTAGDAFSAAFHTPGQAVAAGLEAQRALGLEAWPEGVEVRVRMGVHVGTAHERDGDYFGASVNRAARLTGLAHGGQVLVSLAVEELVRDDLPDGVGLVSLGEHELRGLSRAESVFQLTGDGLESEFSPLRSSVEPLGNLPVPVTSFVGRSDDLKRLAAEIVDSRTRLLTLTGVGGVGKTRLAIELGWQLADEFPDGVWLAELAPVTDEEAVVATVADALDIPPQPLMTMTEAILDVLHSRRLLVIADNCEHLLGPVAALVSQVVHACSNVTVLATSREPLGVEGENVRSVRSLDVTLEGVELFCDRARAADGAFELGDDREVVEGLCERLDGIPLAIELAAARVRSLAPSALAERLEDRFRLLRAGRRGGGLERHRTLRATVEWSYRMLDVDERLLFDRLSVFAGTFDLEAAEAVCADAEQIDELDVVDLLAGLVDKSLVVAERAEHGNRYRLLETLRRYGEEQLEGRGELAQTRDRHLAHYLDVLKTAQALFEGNENQRGRTTFEAEWSNVRAAIDWALAAGGPDAVDQLISSTSVYASFDLRREHGVWANKAMGSTSLTVGVFAAAAFWAHNDGDFEGAVRLAEEGLARAPSPSHPSTAPCWHALEAGHFMAGRLTDAEDAAHSYAQAAAMARPFEASMAAMDQAYQAAIRGDVEVADEHVRRARDLASTLANATLGVYVENFAGRVDHLAGRREAAISCYSRAIELSDESGSNRAVANTAAWRLAECAGIQDAESAQLWIGAIPRLRAHHQWGYMFAVLEALAVEWSTAGRLNDAAVCFGYLEGNELHHALYAADRREALRVVSADTEAAALLPDGAKMDREELVDFVLHRLAEALEP